MSHFVTVVLLPKDTKNVEESLDAILAPYAESLEVDEYDRPCACLELKCRKKATDDVRKKFGEIEKYRNEFRNKINADPVLAARWNENPFDEEVENLWKEFIKKLTKHEKTRFNYHMKRVKRDKECSYCHGVGTFPSTYNPDSKWDWFTIGGRWTGMLSDYDPLKDPNNIEECDICAGTGMRNDELGLEQRKKDPNYTCNGCSGEGKRTKWPSEWKPFQGDILPALRWLALLDQDLKKYTPFAIVTPDGEWHERGEMGWFASVSNEKDADDWCADVRSLCEKYSDCIAVVVDCHI